MIKLWTNRFVSLQDFFQIKYIHAPEKISTWSKLSFWRTGVAGFCLLLGFTDFTISDALWENVMQSACITQLTCADSNPLPVVLVLLLTGSGIMAWFSFVPHTSDLLIHSPHRICNKAYLSLWVPTLQSWYILQNVSVHCFSRSSMFSMKMVLIHTLVSQRVIVMSSDSFVSIVLPMSILLCSITSARIADIVDTCFFVKYLADMGPFLLHWLMLKRWYSRNAQSCCQDEELVSNEINYKDLPEKMLIGTFGPFQETCYPTKFIWEITVEYFNNSCIYFKYHSESIFCALHYNLIEIHGFNINTSSTVSTVIH